MVGGMQILRMNRRELMELLIQHQELLKECSLQLKSKRKVIRTAKKILIEQKDKITRLNGEIDALEKLVVEEAVQQQVAQQQAAQQQAAQQQAAQQQAAQQQGQQQLFQFLQGR